MRCGTALACALCALLAPVPVAAQAVLPEPPHPVVPVLLVPGWFNTGESFEKLQARLRVAGWPPEWVAAITFEKPTGGNREHALEIATAVNELLARTGAPQVDVVAHSMGGLATRLYLREHPEQVRRAVFLATPHRGTYSAYLAFGEGRAEMLPGSALLDSLDVGPPVPAGVEALTVRTPVDTHVIPGVSATLPGVEDVVVCCPAHEWITRSAEAFRVVAEFLRRRPGT